jgi:hypothetical protein
VGERHPAFRSNPTPSPTPRADPSTPPRPPSVPAQLAAGLPAELAWVPPMIRASYFAPCPNHTLGGKGELTNLFCIPTLEAVASCCAGGREVVQVRPSLTSHDALSRPIFSPRGRIGSSFGRSRRDSGLHCSRARAAGAFRRDPIGVCDARSKRSLATKCPFFSSTEGNAEPKRDRRGAIALAPIARPPRAPFARRATCLPRADSPADRARRPAPGREPAPTALSEFSIARASPGHRTPPRTG